MNLSLKAKVYTGVTLLALIPVIASGIRDHINEKNNTRGTLRIDSQKFPFSTVLIGTVKERYFPQTDSSGRDLPAVLLEDLSITPSDSRIDKNEQYILRFSRDLTPEVYLTLPPGKRATFYLPPSKDPLNYSGIIIDNPNRINLVQTQLYLPPKNSEK